MYIWPSLHSPSELTTVMKIETKATKNIRQLFYFFLCFFDENCSSIHYLNTISGCVCDGHFITFFPSIFLFSRIQPACVYFT